MENFGNQSIILVKTDYWEEYTNEEITNMFNLILNQEVEINFVGEYNDICT